MIDLFTTELTIFFLIASLIAETSFAAIKAAREALTEFFLAAIAFKLSVFIFSM